MKFVTTIAVAACLSASGLSADASMAFCFPGPFFGGWGAGYAPAPFYAARPVSYGYAPSYYAGYYGSGGYGCSTCGSGGCSTGCNTGCSTGCSTGCGTGCSGDCGVISSGKVQGPVSDPNFRDGTGERRRGDDELDDSWRNRDKDNDREYDPSRRGPREDDPLDRPAGDRPSFLDDDRGRSGLDRDDPTRRDDEGTDSFRDIDARPDPFDASPIGDGPADDFRTNPDDTNEFGTETRNRIPMTEPEPEPEPESEDGGDKFVPAPEDPEAAMLRKGLLLRSQVRTTSAGARLRLAGQSRERWTQSATRMSGRHNKRKNQTPRWIGVPAADGRVRI